MSPFPPAVHAFAQRVVKDIALDAGGDMLLTGANDAAKRAVAEFLAAKSGSKLCPLGARFLAMPCASAMAMDCIARMSGKAVVVLDIAAGEGGPGLASLVDRLREPGFMSRGSVLIVLTTADDVDESLAERFDRIGSLDESGFVPHCPAPSYAPSF